MKDSDLPPSSMSCAGPTKDSHDSRPHTHAKSKKEGTPHCHTPPPSPASTPSITSWKLSRTPTGRGKWMNSEFWSSTTLRRSPSRSLRTGTPTAPAAAQSTANQLRSSSSCNVTSIRLGRCSSSATGALTSLLRRQEHRSAEMAQR